MIEPFTVNNQINNNSTRKVLSPLSTHNNSQIVY